MRSIGSRRPRDGHTIAMQGIAVRRRRQILQPTLPQPTCRRVANARPSSVDTQPWEETEIQQEIHLEAMRIIEVACTSLSNLAQRSQELRSSVSCDQDDWPGIIRDCFEDMAGDTFGCLPEAIERAQRELRAPPDE